MNKLKTLMSPPSVGEENRLNNSIFSSACVPGQEVRLCMSTTWSVTLVLNDREAKFCGAVESVV